MIRTAALIVGLFLFQSCALLTSCKKFNLDRGEKTSLQVKQTYTDDFAHTVIFFDDGTLLSIEDVSPKNIAEYLENHRYKIYKKFDDYRFKWGVYKVLSDTISFELQEKVHQWGLIEVCLWKGVLKGSNLQILPINRELNGGLDFYTFSENGVTLKLANESLLEKATIDPKLSWVNN